MAVFVVFFGFVFFGATLPKTNQVKKNQAQEVAQSYSLVFAKTIDDLNQIKSHKERVRQRPGYEALFQNWEKDREKCAGFIPEKQIYHIDSQLYEIEVLTRQ